MDSEYFDEEGLLKVIKAFELSEAITKLNWNWGSYSDAIKQAHELMEKSQKLFLEITEYEQRMGSKLTKYQKNKINSAVEDLGKLVPYMKNKIKPTEIGKGDGFTVETAGGGGFWIAFERPAEKVLADVRSGYVSLEAARRDYGVAITQRGRKFELDIEATAALRRSQQEGI